MVFLYTAIRKGVLPSPTIRLFFHVIKKVIDLSGINAAADHNGKEPIASNVAGNPPKAKPEVGT